MKAHTGRLVRLFVGLIAAAIGLVLMITTAQAASAGPDRPSDGGHWTSSQRTVTSTETVTSTVPTTVVSTKTVTSTATTTVPTTVFTTETVTTTAPTTVTSTMAVPTTVTTTEHARETTTVTETVTQSPQTVTVTQSPETVTVTKSPETVTVTQSPETVTVTQQGPTVFVAGSNETVTRPVTETVTSTVTSTENNMIQVEGSSQSVGSSSVGEPAQSSEPIAVLGESSAIGAAPSANAHTGQSWGILPYLLFGVGVILMLTAVRLRHAKHS